MLAQSTRCAARLALTILALLTAVGSAAAAPALLPLAPGATDAAPAWRELARDDRTVRLEVALDAFRVDEIQFDGEAWRALTLDGGAIHGDDGAPGLPVATRLVAVPRGATVTGRVVRTETIPLPDLRLFPVQPGHAAEFVVDDAAYAAKSRVPMLRVGEPAVMAGRTVVPVTVSPLDYDPASGAATAARTIEIELTIDGGAPDTRPPAASFDGWMRGNVVGHAGLSGPTADKAGAERTHGTWVLVRRDVSGVIGRLAPLVAWRERQGYHVEIVDADAAGGTNSAVKSAIQTLYDDPSIPPVEFIVLAGDVSGSYGVPTWTETQSHYNGPGDHYYATLEGGDVLADAHVGRLSFETLDQLETMVAKIVSYEQTPPMDDTSWFGRASLQGDPSASGITTIYVNQWLKGHLEAMGWSRVDTTWSGNFSNDFFATVNPGVSMYGYRGYLGMSGISSSYIDNLNNGGRLPVAIIPTCDTGTITQSNCRSEAWLRAPNGGGIAAVGTATQGTHTRYNNCYYHGVWNGLLYDADHRIGVAHSLGKLELYLGYQTAEPDIVEIWSVWNSLMGDPATDIWIGVPTSLDVVHPASLPPGASAIPLTVSSGGLPVGGLAACVYRDGEFKVTAFTDASGSVLLPVPDLASGPVQVTVTGHGRLPYLGVLSVGSAATFCALEQATVGGDGLLNPGDEVEVQIAVRNEGVAAATGVTATLGEGVPYGAVVVGALEFGDVAPGATVWATAPATVSVPVDAAHGATVSWPLTVTDGVDVWESVVEIDVTGTALRVAAAGAPPAPGASGDLVIDLVNDGAAAATGLTATLTSDTPWVVVSGGAAVFPDAGVGATVDNAASPFVLTVVNECYAGHLAALELTVTDAAGAVTRLPVALTVGAAATSDPLGPDAYGYYAYDDTDLSSGQAPVYDWIALDPGSGGPGTDLGLGDFGWEQDDTKTVDLPFTFRYYGVDYDRVSICSNGWLAMGEMNLVHYRNFGIPSAGSPGAMIAPFWDNLYQTATARVYTWYDEAEHRYVVQWADMPNDYSNAVQNVEVVLYDPSWHQTATGDGMILFQYETVANTDSRDGYATVGIQNAARTDGLMYTFWNAYADAAAPLATGRAILFKPLGEILQPAADVSPAGVVASAAPGGSTVEYLHIGNTGEAGSKLNYDIEIVDPLTRSAAKSLAGSDVKLNASQYEPGTSVTLDVAATCVSGDWEWLMEVILDVPPGVTVVSAGDMPNNHGTMSWDGVTGDGVTTSWGGGGYIDHNETGHAELTLAFDPGLVGDVEIDWTVNGDNYGAPPHSVSGTIVLAPTDPAIYVTAPLDGDTAVIGTSLDVTFLAVNGPAVAIVELQREAGGAWTTLATGVDLSLGTWSWTVSGDAGPYAVIRVTDELDAAVSGLSGVFKVSRDMGWLSLDAPSGQVGAGVSVDVALTLDATGLSDGVHTAELDVIHNGGPRVTVPVTFTVGGSVDAPLPARATLLGAHPNPFNPQTLISFALPSTRPVTLKVYSAQGRLVRTLLTGTLPAGVHRVLWDGRDGAGREVASGVYLYRLTTPEGAMSGKAALLK